MEIIDKRSNARNRVYEILDVFEKGLKIENGWMDDISSSYIGVMQLQAESRAESDAIINGAYALIANRLGDDKGLRNHRILFRRAVRWL